MLESNLYRRKIKDMITKVLDEKTVKLNGRTYTDENGILWCGMSGSGAEFIFSGEKLVVTAVGDYVAEHGNDIDKCRLAVCVNGERVLDKMICKNEESFTVIDKPVKNAEVNIIKLSECAMSAVGIKPVEADEGAEFTPVERKPLRIEFIGDSITCGYGVDDEVAENPFSTHTEDVTKAYAYKTAKALDAEYSMFSASGYGIISGWTGDGTKNPDQTIPQFYKSHGFTYGSFGDKKPQDISWDFGRYVPQIVVINLGTNDDSYCGSDEQRRLEYKDSYKAFLKEVRELNPNAYILCVLGMMEHNMYPYVEKACEEYKAETGDKNISSLHLTEQNVAEDGFAANWHPTAKTHSKASAAVVQEIRNIIDSGI